MCCELLTFLSVVPDKVFLDSWLSVHSNNEYDDIFLKIQWSRRDRSESFGNSPNISFIDLMMN